METADKFFTKTLKWMKLDMHLIASAHPAWPMLQKFKFKLNFGELA